MKILSTGGYLPPKVLTNDDMAKMVDTNHQWIVERTGIHERRVAAPHETPSFMAYHAALQALEKGKIDKEEIDLILFAVTIPDHLFPNTASMLQARLGIQNQCACLDVNAACSGWIYGFIFASSLIKTGMFKKILLIGCEMTSGFNNWEDRSTSILFGDGAGAMILGRSSDNETSTTFESVLSSDSTKKDHLILPAGGAAKPIRQDILDKKEQYISMNGQEVFKAAVKTMAQHCQTVLEKSNIKPEDVTWFIPHQANLRIIEAVANRLNFPMEKVIVNVDRFANTSSASIPLAFNEALELGKIKRGDIVMFAAFGAGLTSGAIVIRY